MNAELDSKLKAWIDNATYEDLLRKWRNAPSGSAFFIGTIGDYYAERMKALKEADSAGAVRASKNIG